MSFVISDLWTRTQATDEVIPRQRLHLLRFKLPPMAAAQQASALRLQLSSFFPGKHFAYVFSTAAEGLVLCWAWEVDPALPARQVTKQWPEPLKEPAADGLRLVRRQAGFEAQSCADGQVQLSRWWPKIPDELDWTRFVRAAGQDCEQHPLPQPVSLRAEVALPKGWRSGNNLPKPDPWKGWHWQVMALALAMTVSGIAGLHWQSREQLKLDKQLLSELRSQREAMLNERAKYETLRQDHEALRALAPKLSQLELLDRVIGSGVLATPIYPDTGHLAAAAPVLSAAPGALSGNAISAQAPGTPPAPPPPTPMLAEWDYRNSQLKLTLDIPEGEIAMLDTTRRIERLANFSGLKIGLETSNSSLVLTMKVGDGPAPSSNEKMDGTRR